MPRIQQTRLRARFIISMLIMFIPLMIFSAGAIISFNVMNEMLEEVVEEASEEMHPVMKLQIQMIESSMPLHDYFIHGDQEEREAFIRLSRNVDRIFEEVLSAPFAKVEEKELIQTAYREWLKSRGIGEALLSGPVIKDDKTFELQMENLDGYIENSVATLDKFHDIVMKEMDELLVHAKAVRQKIYILITSIFLIGLAIAFAATIVLTRSILFPLRILEKATEHLTEGDLACRVPLDTRDEFGNLARAFNMMAARLENSQAALEELATIDPLTEVLNRREFYRLLIQEMKRSRRYNKIFSLLIFDIDLFKEINDSYGHPFGDKVLRLVADLTRGEIRPGDIIARYGGDEFVLILPETAIANGIVMAERIRNVISSEDIHVNDGQTVNLFLSIGIAEFPTDGQTEEELIATADEMLYVAKRKGGNYVHSAHLS